MESSDMVRVLTFETPKPESTSVPLPVLPNAQSDYPASEVFEEFFFSAAVLDGVEEIVPCRNYSESGKLKIIGLLLQFPENRRSCVGQIRMDLLESPLQVRGHQSIWLGFSEDYGPIYVSSLELSCPAAVQGVTWFEVELSSTLEWWFSERQCQVYHMGRSSPITWDTIAGPDTAPGTPESGSEQGPVE